MRTNVRSAFVSVAIAALSVIAAAVTFVFLALAVFGAVAGKITVALGGSPEAHPVLQFLARVVFGK